jgi:hypothetical protein
MRSVGVLVLSLFVLSTSTVSALTFELEARKFKCFTEEFPAGFHVAFNYAVGEGYAQYVDVKVTDPENNVILDDEGKDKSSNGFVAEKGGDYAFCFYSRLVTGVKYAPGMKRKINFEVKSGADSNDYATIAKKEHLRPVELALRIMEDTVRAIYSEYNYYKERENRMRETSEHMNARAAWLSVLSIVLAAGYAVWQVRHLKFFFKRKRLID